MFKATQTHVGQYRRYGDFFREWDIETDLTEEQMLNEFFNTVYRHKVPEIKEYKERINSDKRNDFTYYFNGFYEARQKNDGTYHITICEPYCD